MRLVADPDNFSGSPGLYCHGLKIGKCAIYTDMIYNN
jgi:hypothetical protein